MLEYRRPAGSRTERIFVREYLESLPGWDRDREENVHVWVPLRGADGCTDSVVVWSSHTDTVHRKGGKQIIDVGARKLTLATSNGPDSNCLGADDTVGVWLMREMILAGIPGHYVFHFGEEKGGIGSSGIVGKCPQLFDGAKAVIALDRRGTRDIITHQGGERCCSNAFAKSLAKQLRSVARYRPSDRGTYTDSAEYVGIVSECTNISVGYDHEHTVWESVDYWHALKLCNALCRFDESRLVFERDPWAWDDDDDDGRWKYRGESTSSVWKGMSEADVFARYSYKRDFSDLTDEDKQVIRDLWGLK